MSIPPSLVNKLYEEAEKQKRSKKLQKVIAEMSENYNVSIDEIEIPSSWTNKTAFTVKSFLIMKQGN